MDGFGSIVRELCCENVIIYLKFLKHVAICVIFSINLAGIYNIFLSNSYYANDSVYSAGVVAASVVR